MVIELDEVLRAVVQVATTLPSGRNLGGVNAIDAVLRVLEILDLATWEMRGDGVVVWQASESLGRLASKRKLSMDDDE